MVFCALALSAAVVMAETPPIEGMVPNSDAVSSVAQEPLFADLVLRARGLKQVVDQWISAQSAKDDPAYLQAFSAFKREAEELAHRDRQGHLVLKERGTDGDLTCILRGISEDIPVKIAAVEAAENQAAHRLALEELAYLLNDNVEVILAPPVAP